MLHYQTIRHATSEEWVVFIHGAGGSSNVWYRQLRVFAKRYNILLIDLRGHGLSAMQKDPVPAAPAEPETYTFPKLARDVVEVLDHLGLRQCHFVGLSLGTIIIREIVEIDSSYVRSMILAGAVLKLDARARFLSRTADLFKRMIPYMTLYRIYAYLIMPHPAHRNSRLIFISNALKISHNEFLNWMTLNRNLNDLLNIYNTTEPPIPTLYVMGESDYVFLSQVRMQLQKSHRNSCLYIIPQAGHICNIDNSEAFNATALAFLNDFGSTTGPF